jgi:hypothetical protein
VSSVKMEHLSSAMGQQHEQVEWRRYKVQELCSRGCSQREINIDMNRQSKNDYHSCFKFLIASAAAF